MISEYHLTFLDKGKYFINDSLITTINMVLKGITLNVSYLI